MSLVDSFMKMYNENLKKRIIEEGESNQECTAYCPHCGEERDDFYELLLERVDEWSEITCYKCEKDFFICWQAVYSTKKKGR
jgi:hypothetical protein